MNTQWRKIAGDFRQHRLQIGLIGAVLMLGTAGVIAALNARSVLDREIAVGYARAKSPDIALWFDRVDDRLLGQVRATAGVAAADARRVAATRIEGEPGIWLPARLLIVRDFADQRTGLVHQHGGAWPAGDAGILIEQSSMPLLRARVGEALRIRKPGGGIAAIPIAGVVHDTAVAPSTQERIIYAYATPAVAAQIGQGDGLDQVVVLMEDRNSGMADLIGDLRDELAKSGHPPVRIEGLPFGHPHAALMNAMLRVLGVMAAMAFTCSAALASFVVSLWMKREVRQVGVMKTMGARSHQLAGQYLALVGPLVVAATLAAWPLGTFAGGALIDYYQTSLNIDVASRQAAPGLLLAELLGALGIPLVAMALPIVRAARVTAREAIQDPGITAQGSPRTLTARVIRMPGHRQWTFALRNSFRRPGRLALTLIGLSMGGALLLTSCNLYESLMHVVDLSLAGQGHDVEVTLPRPVAGAGLEKLARTIPGVETAEAWRRVTVGLSTSAEEALPGSQAHHFALTGYPPETQLLKMEIKEGRWPLPSETDAVVITRYVKNQVHAVKTGGTVTLHFQERAVVVRVVGMVDEIVTPMIYANFPTYEMVTGKMDGLSSDLRVRTSRPEAVVAALDGAFFNAGIAVSQLQTRADRREVLDEHFLVVTSVASVVALAVALVGGICLAAFASLNVLERVREVGVIRTLGATPRAVTAIFLAESGSIALLSAVLALVLSLFATRALNDMTARMLLQVDVPLVVSVKGLAWLAGGGVLVLVGVWLPVRRLLRMSVRDALAYE